MFYVWWVKGGSKITFRFTWVSLSVGEHYLWHSYLKNTTKLLLPSILFLCEIPTFLFLVLNQRESSSALLLRLPRPLLGVNDGLPRSCSVIFSTFWTSLIQLHSRVFHMLFHSTSFSWPLTLHSLVSPVPLQHHRPDSQTSFSVLSKWVRD